MRIPRSLGLAAAVLAAAGSLAACGSDSGSGDDTLHVVGWKGGGAEPANVAEINAAFQKANPDIKLDFSYVPPNDVYLQKVQSQLLAGDAADVIMVDPQKVQAWGKSGYLADLGQESWAGGISPTVKSFVSYEDKVLASPMELSPVGVYVNLDILAKAGITAPPTDFPSLLDALGKLKAAGQPGYSFPDAQGYMAEFVMLMSAATTVYQDTPDWDQQFMKGKVTFPKSFTEPLEQIEQLGRNGYVDFQNAVGTDETTTGQPDFIAGKSAFYAGGSWLAAAMKKASFKLAFIPWPGGEAGSKPSAMFFPGTMWAVNARGEQQDAAKRYVDFWSKSANLAPFLSAEAAISPFGGAGADSDPLLATMVEAYADKRFALFPANTWNLAEPETKIRSLLQNFLLGKASVSDTLNGIQDAAKPAGS
ncbi:ABC transporter substrate-binding protein [Actinophytocola oryzae]|uniref:Carbohydrate ABC transporter substrate-binding protein (CUT1 family) n=1 Tax=Actinophytocola oryzae TaxID=502181 RepID=A0A4R7W4J9_9PSEU|nr:extracellular solute-binding protein [Actinophytocola oryzae]TDV57650.1 carbohydrate ABC transporter substrate-binding protein (CUT1 family) [Actinophytocola oryzae]